MPLTLSALEHDSFEDRKPGGLADLRTLLSQLNQRQGLPLGQTVVFVRSNLFDFLE